MNATTDRGKKMRMNNLKTAMIGVTSAAAVSLALGISPAAATPPPFTIDPNALTTTGGPFALVPNLGDYQGSSDALVQQTGPTTQTETGWVQGTTFQDIFGNPVGSNLTRMNAESAIGSPGTSVYNLYLQFSATVHGLSGFSPGPLGTIAPGGLVATLYADMTSNDTFTPGSSSSTGGTAPTVTDNAPADKVLGVFTSITGDAGVDASTGAPRLDVVATFLICDGVGTGDIGATEVTGGAAAACNFDATSYFVSPNPFYDLAFNSSQAGSALDLSSVNPGLSHPGGPEPNLELNGIVTDINFIATPEPATLAMFGFGLIGLGWFARQRRKST